MQREDTCTARLEPREIALSRLRKDPFTMNYGGKVVNGEDTRNSPYCDFLLYLGKIARATAESLILL